MSLSPADLRGVTVLADLADSELQWLIDHGQVFEYPTGTLVARSGDPPEWMYILLEGELVFYWANLGDAPYATKAGGIIGALPYSRLTGYNGYGVAEKAIRTLAIHRDLFPAMLQAIPALGPRLVGIMIDRVRDITRLDLREEKLLSLGKLSAGLAHELNNPAAAAHRAAAQFGEAIQALESHTLTLTEQLDGAALKHLLTQAKTLQATPLGPLEQSDLEQALADWLEARQIPQAWKYAPVLVAAGVRLDWLEGLGLQGEALSLALGWLVAYLSTQSLARDIQTSTQRISAIVMAVKRYTHMDQALKQAVDIQQGLEDTLALFAHQLKQGVRVEKDYADLPRLEAFGGELNQIWTNLIDNALDAMNGSGTLRLRTALEGNQVLVEIADSGPGIPQAIQDKIFDPFFTTKEVGQGTGLGLDTVRRIVQRHRGSLRVESKPGETRFQVRLPLTSKPESKPEDQP